MYHVSSNDNRTINFQLEPTFILIQVLFIVLKIEHIIEWNWLWIVFPSILNALLSFAMFSLVLFLSIRDAKNEKEYRDWKYYHNIDEKEED